MATMMKTMQPRWMRLQKKVLAPAAAKKPYPHIMSEVETSTFSGYLVLNEDQSYELITKEEFEKKVLH